MLPSKRRRGYLSRNLPMFSDPRQPAHLVSEKTPWLPSATSQKIVQVRTWLEKQTGRTDPAMESRLELTGPTC